MNTDEPAAHFAWDLLDSAKQALETQVAEKPAAAEPAPQAEAPDPRPERQPVIQPVASELDDAPIGQPEPPEKLVVEPASDTGEPSPAMLQPKPTADELQVRTGLLEPESEMLPTGQATATAIIPIEAAAAIEEPCTASLQSEPPAEKGPAGVDGPRAATVVPKIRGPPVTKWGLYPAGADADCDTVRG